MIRKLGMVAAIIVTNFVVGEAMAATATTTFQVTATVLSSCTASAPTLAFGNYNPSSATVTNGSTTISVYCTSGTAFTTALDVGTTVGGAFTQRLMQGPANTLGYNLYTDNTYTTVWGDGTGSTATVAGTGAGPLVAVNQTVYGQIAAQQNVGAGSYSDTITVTVTY